MVDSKIDWNKNRTTWSSVLDKVHIPPPTSEQQWTSPSTPFSWPWCHSTRNHWAQKLLKSQANQKNKLWRGAVQKRSSTGIVLVTRVLAGLLPGSVWYTYYVQNMLWNAWHDNFWDEISFLRSHASRRERDFSVPCFEMRISFFQSLVQDEN